MELCKRKDLRLREFDYNESGAYFITVCTHNRQNLFGEMKNDVNVGATLCGRPQAAEIASHWIKEIENKFVGVKVDEFVVMPDHIHLILILTGDHTGSPLREKKPYLGEIIGWYKTMTTNEYIKQVKRGILPPFDKHVWQRNYYEHVIRNKEDLKESQNYIKSNPKVWVYKNM